MTQPGTLLFFCGKMGAGKTTHSVRLAREIGAVLISEDEWLAKLYPQDIADFNDYLKFSTRIKPLLKTHIQNILQTGVSVVLDFPGNTRSQRTWFLQICHEIGAAHRLIYLNISDQKCLQQLGQRRNTAPERAAFDTEEMFHQISSYFQKPDASEGLVIETLLDPVNNLE